MKTPQVDALPGVTPLGLLQLRLNSFEDYCMEFYGDKGLYDYGFTRAEIREATIEYLASPGTDYCGDSLDRERVRDLVLARREAFIDRLEGAL